MIRPQTSASRAEPATQFLLQRLMQSGKWTLYWGGDVIRNLLVGTESSGVRIEQEQKRGENLSWDAEEEILEAGETKKEESIKSS